MALEPWVVGSLREKMGPLTGNQAQIPGGKKEATKGYPTSLSNHQPVWVKVESNNPF